MKRLVFVGAHLGYPLDKTPLGGGAAVGVQLLRHWAGRGVELVALGSGPEAPAEGVEYARVAEAPGGRALESLSEREYGRFCRSFEAAATRWIVDRRMGLAPEETCVVANDISESPDLEALARAGYPVVTVWHVDVVDYFNKLYLRRLVPAPRLTGFYEAVRRAGAAPLVPDLLKLVFDKQRQAVAFSGRLVLPSSAMARTLTDCYGVLAPGRGLEGRLRVVPWGGWDEPRAAAPDDLARLRARCGIGPGTAALLTMSRISPEKGLHLLLEAVRRLEVSGRLDGKDLVLLLCGAPAYMQGRAYLEKVRREAARLRKARVVFGGHLSREEKAAHFAAADLFVSPSVHESYGLTIVEAMRAGLPVLALDHYGVRDWLSEGCGRVVPYDRLAQAPARLADALSEMLADREALRAMGLRAKEAGSGMRFSDAADSVLAAAREAVKESR